MSDETLENFIRQYIDGQDGEQVVFSGRAANRP